MKSKVISSLVWKLLERGGTQFVQFIVQIILARLLVPEDYGAVAIVAIFISVANVFVQNGFNTALIQQKNVDETDLSSVFFLSLGIALLLYIILFFTSPIIATFYKQPILVPVIRVLALSLFLGAINSIQHAIVARNLEFKKYFFGSIGGIIISGTIGIFLAYKGFGIWSLVWQQLINVTCVVIILSFMVKWRPKLLFSIKRLKKLFSYGWKILCSSLIDTIYKKIYELVIGRKFDAASLAYYNRGEQFPNVIVQNIDGAVNSVMLPALSKEQDNKSKVKQMMRRSIVTSSFVIFPITFGLVAVAKPMILVVLTEKWSQSIPFVQLLAIAYAFWPIHTANLQAINSIGRSDIFLKLEKKKKVIGILILIVTIPMGLIPMAIGQIASGVISTFVNAFPNKKLLNYSYFEQIKDIAPSLFISVLMSLIVYSVGFLHLSNFITLVIQVIIGITVYILLAIILKLECFNYLISTFKEMMKKREIKKA